MTMNPALRKITLTAHVISSVGWLGAVTGFVALALVGLTSEDIEMVQMAYPAMGLITSQVIIPFSIASLLTGLIQSLGTKWGIIRHYWVLIKLVITVVSILILMVHAQPIAYLAEVSTTTIFSGDELRSLRIQMAVDASAALIALMVATTLSVYKPRGITPYGWRQLQKQRGAVLGK